MEELSRISSEAITALDRVEKAQFMVSDIQKEVYGGYIAPSLEDYTDSADTRNNVHLEMVKDYLSMISDQLSRIFDMATAPKAVAV